MTKCGREVPLPDAMQGKWVDSDDLSSELIISGSDIVCFGQAVAYDYKVINYVDGALTVSLKINDATEDDSFQRANITELVITPEGEFHAYNVKFASLWVRPD
jgi:hypothetical protein